MSWLEMPLFCRWDKLCKECCNVDQGAGWCKGRGNIITIGEIISIGEFIFFAPVFSYSENGMKIRFDRKGGPVRKKLAKIQIEYAFEMNLAY